MSSSIGQEDIQQVYAQLAENNLNNQAQVQHMAELENGLSQVSAELFSALSTIRELTDDNANRQPHHSSSIQVRVDALKIGPWKFEGYGDNAELWVKELENNLENSHCPFKQWSALAVNFLDEEGRLFWHKEKDSNNGVALGWSKFFRKVLEKV